MKGEVRLTEAVGKQVTAQFVGACLRRLGFHRENRGRIGQKVGSVYVITREQIEKVKARYAAPEIIATLQQTEPCNTVTDCKSTTFEEVLQCCKVEGVV